MRTFYKEHPECNNFFSFQEFNPIQKACLPKIYNDDHNMVVSAPTSSGKTVIFQLAMLKETQRKHAKCLYLAPMKSLCHEKFNDWKQRFKNRLKIIQVTGDSMDGDAEQFVNYNLVIATPEKIDYLSRQNLQFFRHLHLLLIDEVHMLNFEERGATLQAIVSRIISLNKDIRIIAVSATIPNINEVAEWLKVPKPSICIFGEEYRPAKINKVVLGFKSSNNPFTFEKILNYKVLQAIRKYSEGKGTLIFCPTQKGTESACEQVISQMSERQFIYDDAQLLSLIQNAKEISNGTLQTMIPMGVAFHNASLSMHDRTIVERLFLELKIRVLCTTSTLSMGINLPARLVIIKSTKSYKGSVKGYQQYTRIEMDQMMGRAGRPPFDTQGTVVIMTEKENYNKHMSNSALQNLESQLFTQLIEHVNAQISMKSIKSFNDLLGYFMNSFCYIRMKKSPIHYGVEGELASFIRQSCLKCVLRLSRWNIISFSETNESIAPKNLSNVISKCSIEVSTVIHMMQHLNEIESERQFLEMLCSADEISTKFRSKLDERRVLKDINQKNRFVVKQAITSAARKCFVLVQAELTGFHIDNWEMRKQINEVFYYFKRLNYCLKNIALQMMLYYPYLWSCCYLKYFQERCWENNQQLIIKQFRLLNQKIKNITARGIQNITQVRNNYQNLGAICGKNQQFRDEVRKEVQNVANPCSYFVERRQTNIFVNVSFCGEFTSKLKGVHICVGDSKGNLYHQRYMNQKNKEIKIAMPIKSINQEFIFAIVKDGYIGFDQFYMFTKEKLTKVSPQQIHKSVQKLNSNPKKPIRFIKDKGEAIGKDKSAKKRSKSHEFNDISKVEDNMKNKRHVSKSPTNNPKYNNEELTDFSQGENEHQRSNKKEESTIKRSKQLKLTKNYSIRRPLSEVSSEEEEEITLKKRIRKDETFNCKPLHQYKWKPGFEEIKSESSQPEKFKKQLKIKEPSKASCKQSARDEPNVKEVEVENMDVFNYFYNLFE